MANKREINARLDAFIVEVMIFCVQHLIMLIQIRYCFFNDVINLAGKI